MPLTPATSRAALLSCLLAGALAAPAAGQDRPGVFAEATAGVGAGGGGTRSMINRTGLAIDGLAGARLGALGGGRLLLALSAGTQGSLDYYDACALTADSSCPPSYPLFSHVAVLAGWEGASDGGMTVRLLAGPSYYAAGINGSTGGVQARADVGLPLLSHLAFLLSVRGGLIPDYHGESFRLGALGIGLAVH